MRTKEQRLAFEKEEARLEKEKQKTKERIIQILAAHKIKIEVAGCGCCGSPMFKFEYNGELILASENNNPVDDFNINMFD